MAPTKTGPIRSQMGPMKTFATKHITRANDLLASEVPTDSDDLKKYIRNIQLTRDNLSSAVGRLQAKHDEWVGVLKDYPEEQEYYDDAVGEIMELLLNGEEIKNELNIQLAQSRNDLTSSSTPTTGYVPQSSQSADLMQPTTQAPHAKAFKAPKIKLPSFDGDYMHFKQFWGVFEANIHEREDLSNTEKFTYLLSQLEGDAKHCLAGVMVTDDNYDTAVALLKSRFDRADERIIAMLYSEFMQLPVCGRKTADKQRTLDDCERIFRQLQTAGEDVNSNKSLSIGLLSKFPAGMVKDLQRYYHVGPNSTLNEVREGLNKSIAEEEATSGMIGDLQAMKMTKSTNPPTNVERSNGKWMSNQKPNDDGRTFFNSAMPAVAAKQQPHTTKGPQMLSPPSGCYFCGGAHFNSECREYPTARDRVQRLRQLNRCTRCLKVHDPGRCPFFFKCVHCGTNWSHAGAVCYRQFPAYDDNYAAADRRSEAATHAVRANEDNYPVPQPFPRQVGDSNTENVLQDVTSGGLTALNHSGVKPALFQTAKTTAFNPRTGDRVMVRLAMDTLSNRSFIREPIAHKLGLLGNQSEKLFVSVFGTSKTLVVPTTRVNFEVCLRDGSRHEVEANTTKIICQSGAVLNNWTDKETKTLNYYASALADDPFDDNGTIDVLIGASQVWEFIEGPRMSTPAPGLFLIPSKFGLMLAGESERGTDDTDNEPTMLCITESSCQFPSELGMASIETKFQAEYPDVDEFWKLETIGIQDNPVESDDDKALEMFQRTVQFNDEEGRYQVTWPWIEEKRDMLPTNYSIAYDRMRSLTNRLRRNPELVQVYRDILKLQSERGIIEEVPADEIETKNTVHYLPHHPVIKDSNTTRVRIVFDAAAKQTKQSLSLNDCLLRGPVILPDLCQLLMRFRVHETVVISDIEKAFLQVCLQPHERDVTRFLWYKDDNNLSLKDNLSVRRFKRVNFGVISSPFLLAATLDYHLTRENSAFAESLRNDIYVDNVISGLNDGDDPLDYYKALKALFSRAGMNIQEFCSNSKKLTNSIPPEDRVRNTDGDVKVLGMKWDSQNDDTLRLIRSSKFDSYALNPTKRKVLQAIASVFDPLGFFQPVLLPAKIFLQKLWENKYSWDDPLSTDLCDEWKALSKALEEIFEHRIPRFVGLVTSDSTIAVFCDASGKAYSATVYLRCRNTEGKWQSHLMFAKTRLAPSAKKPQQNRITLPRLELLGTVIGVRAGIFSREGLKLPAIKLDFFIDSECVLHWVRRRGLLKRFVANRVDEIHKVANCEFHYVPTSDNPADFGTRGKLPDELCSSTMWWNGPEWLTREPSEWPRSNVPPVTDEMLRQMQAEIRPVYFEQTLAVNVPEVSPNFLAIKTQDVSSLQKLIRISVICVKFLKIKLWNKLSQSTKDAKPELQRLFDGVSSNSDTSASDYEIVKQEWVKVVQQTHFLEVYDCLCNGIGGQFSKQSVQMINQLGLQLDQFGIIRSHGRYEHSDLPDAAKNPMLLPKEDRFTKLVVEDVHSRVMHSGVSHTLSQVRLEFWIPHGRALVRTVVRKCLVCRHYKTGRPFKLPPMPPLPRERVSSAAPFQTSGLDYFGPINVKVNDTITKMWVCLYTCLSVRAVHLEPVMDFTSQEFLHSLIRFTSRRGAPQKIISDNAAQFQLVKILGDQAWKRRPTDETITSYAANNGITWRFITELAPWQGGFYERLVGLVKSTLKTSIRRKLLSWTDFITLLTETEAVVNSRPITYINDDVNSRFRVLRPVDFLVVRPNALTDSSDGSEVSPKTFGEAGKRLVSIWKQRCRTLNALWKCWYNDYLLSLRERRTVSHKNQRSSVDKLPLLQQVVLICDSDAPRGQWRLARIVDLPIGNDGRIRSAELQLANGVRLRRPLNHLVPLEVERTEDDDHVEADDREADADQLEQPPANQDQPSLPDDQPSIPDGADAMQGREVPAEEDEDDFFGYSVEDVQRAMDALNRFDSVQAPVVGDEGPPEQ